MLDKSEITWLETIDKLLSTCDRILISFSCLSLFVTMCIVFLDVLLRYLFTSPLTWSYTFIGFYLMVAIFFLATSDAFRFGAHVKVDFMAKHIPLRIRALVMSLGYVCGAVVICFWSQQAWSRMSLALINDERLATTIQWPTWITHAIILIGSVLMALNLILCAIKYFIFVFTDNLNELSYQAIESADLTKE
ncbi:TRAP-type C4-dicarboxylate transport system, small permease component [Oligella urethralis]|uniref:TRAP transporter small permease n=1 Tax=Oligella urethralis TaxID=90245 RepID=UPI000CFF7056|nr:TRAP transporter small permease [Oligella urethralis]AVL71958.1 hypothetical protein CEQ07_11340 [Oligella urethralis]SUA52129.1 TRAP-type C4-dicarboxylate transport system, small permease component [Oligella urethralis]